MSFYFDGDGKTIKVSLLDSEAEAKAEEFLRKIDYGKESKKSLNSTQLRRFFNDFKSLERKLESKPPHITYEEAYKPIHPLVKMAKAKVAYANERGLLPTSFVEWFNRCINNIDTVYDFKAFLLHFEAIVGYCYGKGLSTK